MGVQRQGEELALIENDLDELVKLLSTLGIASCGRMIQKRQKLSAGLLLGKGKIQEICDLAKETGATHLVVDHPLSGMQVKNLEELSSCQVLDRSSVILDIFSKHAKTREARTQVEIAKLEYLLPRLVGAWTHFTKQAGSGMGEKQIEVDRRRARDRILLLKKKLGAIP